MQVLEGFELTSSEFLRAFDDIERLNLRLPFNPKMHVTTITFNASLCTAIDTLNVRTVTDIIATPDATLVVRQGRLSASSVEFTCPTLPSINVKLMNGGKLHVTGCKSHIELAYACTEICRFLTAKFQRRYTVVAASISMVNVIVSLERGIHLDAFADLVRAQDIYCEQPERPPSVNLRIKTGHMSTSMVYRTGKIVISGRCASDISHSYRTILGILRDPALTYPLQAADMRRVSAKHISWHRLLQAAMPGILHTHLPVSFRVPGCKVCAAVGNALAV